MPGQRPPALAPARREPELLPTPLHPRRLYDPPRRDFAPLALQNKRIFPVQPAVPRQCGRFLQQVARDPRHLGAEIGFFSVLHTWNQRLQQNPSLMMPGIIISFIFSKQGRWVSRTTLCRTSLPVRRSRSITLRTVSLFKSARRISQGARGVTCSRFNRPASTSRSIVR